MHLPGNLVAQGFARDNSDFLAYPFVCMEIQSETWVILLNYELRGLFDRLRSYTTLQIVERQIWINDETQYIYFIIRNHTVNHEHNLNLKSQDLARYYIGSWPNIRTSGSNKDYTKRARVNRWRFLADRYKFSQIKIKTRRSVYAPSWLGYRKKNKSNRKEKRKVRSRWVAFSRMRIARAVFHLTLATLASIICPCLTFDK